MIMSVEGCTRRVILAAEFEGPGGDISTGKKQSIRNQKKSACHLRSCRFIVVVCARLKVPARNSPALLFLSRGKKKKEKTISCFSPAEEEQSRGILGGKFQTHVHDGNKVTGPTVTTWMLWQAMLTWS